MKLYYRSHDQEKGANGVFLGQQEEVSYLKTLVLMKNLSHHGIHRKGNMTAQAI